MLKRNSLLSEIRALKNDPWVYTIVTGLIIEAVKKLFSL